MRLYRIIYDCIEEIESAMKGMLAPKYREVFLGRAECREVYKITNVGMVIGGHVTSGKIVRGAQVRLVRDGIIVADDKIASLRRFKDDVKEVQDGYDCGITLERFSDIQAGRHPRSLRNGRVQRLKVGSAASPSRDAALL